MFAEATRPTERNLDADDRYNRLRASEYLAFFKRVSQGRTSMAVTGRGGSSLSLPLRRLLTRGEMAFVWCEINMTATLNMGGLVIQRRDAILEKRVS